jgi:O-antigen ligase
VLQYLTGSFSNEFGGFAQASIKNIASGQDDFRISGPIADPNHWAQALLVVSALALGRARRSRTWQVRCLAAGVLLASVLAIVFSFSRGALVALALTAVIVVCLRPPPAWSVALLGVAAVLALPLLPAGYVDRLGQLAQAVPGISDGRTGEASLSGRLSALVAGRDMALDQPLLGVGAGQFATRYREYSLGLGIDNTEGGVQPHNMYLEVAAETGYLGLLTWGAILGVALYRLHQGRRVLRRAARWYEADLMEDLSLGLVAYLLSGLFVHNAYPRLYWLLIGAALAAPAVVRSVLAARDDTRTPSDAADAQRTAPVLARA